MYCYVNEIYVQPLQSSPYLEVLWVLQGHELCPIEGDVEVTSAVVQLVDLATGRFAIFQQPLDRLIQSLAQL